VAGGALRVCWIVRARTHLGYTMTDARDHTHPSRTLQNKRHIAIYNNTRSIVYTAVQIYIILSRTYEFTHVPRQKKRMSSAACAAQDGLSGYLSSLIPAPAAFEYINVNAGILQDMSAATLLATGAACTFGRLLLGDNYLLRILWMVASLTGAIIASAALAQGSPLVKLLDGAASAVGVEPDGVCLVNIAFVIGSALAFAAATHRIARVGLFAVGAVSAGYGTYIACGLVLPLAAPIVHVDAMGLAQYVWIPTVLLAVAGGLVAQNIALEVLDLVLAVGGALLMAQGLLTFGVPLLSLPDALVDYMTHLQVGMAAVIFLLRQALVGGDRRAHPSGSSSTTEYHQFREPERAGKGQGGSDEGLISR
jgi:hypothetical protein